VKSLVYVNNPRFFSNQVLIGGSFLSCARHSGAVAHEWPALVQRPGRVAHATSVYLADFFTAGANSMTFPRCSGETPTRKIHRATLWAGAIWSSYNRFVFLSVRRLRGTRSPVGSNNYIREVATFRCWWALKQNGCAIWSHEPTLSQKPRARPRRIRESLRL